MCFLICIGLDSLSLNRQPFRTLTQYRGDFKLAQLSLYSRNYQSVVSTIGYQVKNFVTIAHLQNEFLISLIKSNNSWNGNFLCACLSNRFEIAMTLCLNLDSLPRLTHLCSCGLHLLRKIPKGSKRLSSNPPHFYRSSRYKIFAT